MLYENENFIYHSYFFKALSASFFEMNMYILLLLHFTCTDEDASQSLSGMFDQYCNMR